jgi:hypothetical protein
MNHCPNCKSVSGLREIIYGLPAEPIDEEKWTIGGCCISENDPTIACKDCGWEGEFVNNLSEMDFQPNLNRNSD